ncbi:hypothetical protein Taro_053360 [Colocasia esculenta]|uniref:Uncharacterized protein n=1 Tax=Colocasia esculenta TaxID=4460 RepID=A0A843XMK2_COLES|nr:hypothetical protein [Colocasia esculenta]
MAPLLQLQLLVGLFAIAITCVLWQVITTATAKKQQREAPQPPGALPIIGHLHLLKGGAFLPGTLAAMADTYGPVFQLRLGARRTLIVSSADAARECFVANDRALASRPQSAAAKHMGYDYAMFGFAPYGPYWRSVRKLVTVELLSSARVAAFEPVRSAEVGERLREVYELWEEKGPRPIVIDMKRWFKDLSFNIIVRVVAGKQCSSGAGEVEKLKRAIGRFFQLLGAAASTASDFVPALGWVDLWGHEKAMKAVARDMDEVMGSWLQERRRRREVSGADGGDRDFLDVLLTATSRPDSLEFDADKVIKATALAMILGGNDTTVFSLIKNIGVFLNNPEVLRKAQAELDLHVGRRRNVQEADVKKLDYLQAVVKETFRLHPTAPLLQPHEATEDCVVAGFHVPAGTRVLANVWKLQRDPAVWPDPEEYMPERFLDGNHAHVDVKGGHFGLIPFGAGRRICPGVTFSLHVMHLALARLIHSFELGRPPSAAGAPVELDDSLFGSTPLEVELTPRLPPELYR